MLLVIGWLGACTSENDLIERTGADSWLQAANDKVDILFVVDDSCSMAEEQVTLANGFVSFAEQLDDSATDFRVGVIATSYDYADPQRGALIGEPPFLTNSTPDYVSEFATRAQVGISGEDKEKGLEAAASATSALSNLDLNDGFVRPDARMLFVFVSDEEDCSDEGALTGQSADECYFQREQLVPVADYIQDFRELKESAADVQAAAIVGVDEVSCQDIFPGERYMEVARLTGGLVGDICEGDWGDVLSELGLNATGVFSSFQLADAARPDTLEVRVDGEIVPQGGPSGWRYDAATWYIHFAPAGIPPRGSTIDATYAIQSGQLRPDG